TMAAMVPREVHPRGHPKRVVSPPRAPSTLEAITSLLRRGPMNPILAFVVVMLVWTISDFVAKKTQSLLSSLFVASIIFFVGFLTDVFPDDLLTSSSLLGLAGVVVGFIIVHLGTMISLDDFK